MNMLNMIDLNILGPGIDMNLNELLIWTLRLGQTKATIRRMADCESQLNEFIAGLKYLLSGLKQSLIRISFRGKLNKKLEGMTHQYFNKMKEVACKYAARVPNMNMLSWDMIADKNSEVKILEVNATSQSHDWLQFDFGPLFGGHTDEVVNWCVEHPDLARFSNLRICY